MAWHFWRAFDHPLFWKDDPERWNLPEWGQPPFNPLPDIWKHLVPVTEKALALVDFLRLVDRKLLRWQVDWFIRSAAVTFYGDATDQPTEETHHFYEEAMRHWDNLETAAAS